MIEENAESITIPSTWSGDTELQVDVTNTIDATDYTVSHTFRFTVGEFTSLVMSNIYKNQWQILDVPYGGH